MAHGAGGGRGADGADGAGGSLAGREGGRPGALPGGVAPPSVHSLSSGAFAGTGRAARSRCGHLSEYTSRAFVTLREPRCTHLRARSRHGRRSVYGSALPTRPMLPSRRGRAGVRLTEAWAVAEPAARPRGEEGRAQGVFFMVVLFLTYWQKICGGSAVAVMWASARTGKRVNPRRDCPAA